MVKERQGSGGKRGNGGGMDLWEAEECHDTKRDIRSLKSTQKFYAQICQVMIHFFIFFHDFFKGWGGYFPGLL